MITYVGRMLLLAEESALDYMRESFRSEESQFGGGTLLLLLAALVVVAVLGAWLADRAGRRSGRRIHSPRRLFRELCRGHQLDRESRRRLSCLARHSRLPQAASIFIEPRCFDPERWNEKLARHRCELLALRERLFGE